MKNHLFIVGRGRSGSSLLMSMLNMHPEIAFAPEGLFIRNLYGKYGATNSWSVHRLRQFAKDVFTEQRMELWPFREKKLGDYLINNMPYENYSSVCKALYQLNAEKSGKGKVKWLGDKNPHYSLFGAGLRKLFPDARFIHLVRDYESNCASFKSVDFDLNHPIALAYRWKYFNQRIMNDLSDQEYYTCIRYEELIESPEKVLGGICKFLGIAYEARMLEFYRDPASSQSWHHNLQKPIGAVNKREVSFDPDIREQIRHICSGVAGMLGYPALQTTGTRKNLNYYKGLILGKSATFLENFLYFVPLPIRNNIVNIYRKQAGIR